MIFDSAKNRCALQVLEELKKKEVSYSALFRQTKVSHITLQKTLKELVLRDFISKNEKYLINEKGKKLVKKLEELREILIKN